MLTQLRAKLKAHLIVAYGWVLIPLASLALMGSQALTQMLVVMVDYLKACSPYHWSW